MSSLHNRSEEISNSTMDSSSFPALLKHAVYGICLNLKQQVVATHKELMVLRHCSELLESHPNSSVHIISSQRPTQTNYFIKTLIHLGVSCGRIKLSGVSVRQGVPDGIWLVVAEN